MHGFDGSPALGGYQPARAALDGSGKPAALVGLAAAVLYGLGVFLPYYSGGGQSVSLADGGNEVYAIFLLPAVVGIAAALLAMSSGSGTAAGVSAGAAVGAFGMTQFLVAITYRVLSDAEGVSYGIGFYAHGAAAVLALGAAQRGLSLPRTHLDDVRPLNPVLCVVGAIAFVGAGAAILLPEDGVSILDIEDGLLKTSAIAWALVSPAAGLIAAFSKVRARVGFAAGVAIGHLGVVLGMAMQNADDGQGVASGLDVSNEGIYNVSVVISAVVTGAALSMNTQQGAAVTSAAPQAFGAPFGAGAVAGAGTPAGVGAAQWAGDPFGRHQLRYFDGVQWTANVSDHGAQSLDPPVAVPAGPPMAAPRSAGKRCAMGHENSADSLFCTTCGSRLAP